ncbi:MAG: ribosomal subunit interface protein [Magnetococcales bacterium]|nr:ribosomal subunit interface protein [Magnetococcales bacterium]|tara:strand:+ start:7054 stop:7653 length:600 start_codon:yes stop_codon:yes gene_type:complete
MDLQITGLHMEVGDSLKGHCNEAITGISEYFPEIVDANVQFSNKGHIHKVDIKLHASQIHLRAEAEAADYYLAVDDAIEKLKRRLKKYKGRLQKHRRRRDTEKFTRAEQISAVHNKILEESLETAPETETYAPDVQRTDIKEIQTLTVDEAVMQMDLMHTNIFLFNNIDTGAINVVYREDDGSVGWVEIDKVERKAKSA